MSETELSPKENFIQIFNNYITRDGAKELLQWLESSDFFTAPASTKYHGAYAGGLLEHSLNVYYTLSGMNETDEFTAETIAIVSLLHDICKVNFYKSSVRNVRENGQWIEKPFYEIFEKFPCGHSEKSVIILQNFMKLTSEEILAIRAHMGGFDTSVKGGDFFIGKIFELCPLALCLHIADLKATYLLENKKQ